ncbi:biopolymer transport protein TolQ [Thermodesulfovibrio aggregans]|uniref:Biopolymer transport protein TolQ n=1 Tax=Thermodesulfovibrio aggregans TaxID=86166 RepID=A0A0U9HMX0_9BACT|nr:protein TolQ [Thermodesulfovibrio aggregans]GAQ94408.1 biopolymer transport protein TolQ [Thermodesulfovibrio aggregans]
MELTVIDLIKQTGIVAKAVLLILLFFSIFSWAIIFYKWKIFKNIKRENQKFFEAFLTSNGAKELFSIAKRFELSPLASLYRGVFSEAYGKNPNNIEAIVRKYSSDEANKVESYLGFLATTGSTTPFIGLFGTVWGIMDAFRSIGIKGSASIATVAPGIAEALITTAAGLFAAIPAVIAYNYFTSQANKIINEVQDFSETLLKYPWQD